MKKKAYLVKDKPVNFNEYFLTFQLRPTFLQDMMMTVMEYCVVHNLFVAAMIRILEKRRNRN
jgi:hypothetical protein